MPPKATEPHQKSRRVKAPLCTEKAAGEARRKQNAQRITLSPDRKLTGRKSTLLKKEVMDKLRVALEYGNTFRNCCAMAGLSDTTFYRWMKEAESASEGHPLREFRESVKKARAIAEHRNVMFIQQAARKDWRAAAWWLERSCPKHWGRRTRVSMGGDADAPPIRHTEEPKKELSNAEAMTAMKNILRRAEERSLQQFQNPKAKNEVLPSYAYVIERRT